MGLVWRLLPSYTIVRKRVADPYWLNILNIHGFYIDYFSGGMWNYENRLTIPLKPVNSLEAGVEENCEPVFQAKFAEIQQARKKNSSQGFNPRLPSFTNDHESINMLSIDFSMLRSFHPHVNNESTSGGSISYLRRVGSENMINLSLSSSDRLTCNSYDCSGYITTQSAVMFSVRRYLTLKSNFYGGLGAARVKIKQEADYYFFSSKTDNQLTWTDDFSTMFFEMGWAARKGVFSYKVRGIMDFSDIGLGQPSLINRSYLKSDFSDSVIKTREADYRVTGLEVGIGFSF